MTSGFSQLSSWKKRLLVTAFILAETTLLLSIGELGLRAFGYGYSTRPFVEKKMEGVTWHILNDRYYDQFLNVEYNPQRYDFPGTIMVRTPKPQNTFRVFVFGGSAAYGWFFSDYCMGNMLEVMLRKQYPHRRFEVITVAYPALNSHTMRYLAEACARLQPDLFLIYMGNNEITGPYGLQSVLGSKYRSATAIDLIIRVNLILSDVKVFQFLNLPARDLFSKSVEHLKWGGYTGINDFDDPRLFRVYTLFRRNLKSICDTAQSFGVPTALCTVGYNLKDWPPDISMHRQNLSSEELEQWENLYHNGNAAAVREDFKGAITFYEQAATIDDMYALLAYKLAQCYLLIGDNTRALEYYHLAADKALNFSSANRRINGILRGVASGYANAGVRLIDTEATLCNQSPEGIPGTSLFYDQVHLTFNGTYVIAAEIFNNITDLLGTDAHFTDNNSEPLSLEQCKELMGYSTGVYLNELKETKKILQVVPNPPDLKPMITALEQQTKDSITDTVLEGYRQALTLDNDNNRVRYRYVKLLNESGREQEALESARLLVENDPLNWQYNSALIACLNSVNVQKAYQQVKELALLFPEYAGIQQLAGATALKANHVKQGIAYFKRAVGLNEHNAFYHRQLGAALALSGNFTEAENVFRDSLEIDPTQSDAISGDIRTAVYEFQSKENLVKAAEGLRTILRLQPDAKEVRIQLVEILCELKAFDAAWTEIHGCKKRTLNIPNDLLERLQRASGRNQ